MATGNTAHEPDSVTAGAGASVARHILSSGEPPARAASRLVADGAVPADDPVATAFGVETNVMKAQDLHRSTGLLDFRTRMFDYASDMATSIMIGSEARDVKATASALRQRLHAASLGDDDMSPEDVASGFEDLSRAGALAGCDAGKQLGGHACAVVAHAAAIENGLTNDATIEADASVAELRRG